MTYRTVQYRRLLKIIIGSGALYCLAWLLLLGFSASGSPVAHILLSIIGQLTVRQLFATVVVNVNLLIPVIFTNRRREYTPRSSSYLYP